MLLQTALRGLVVLMLAADASAGAAPRTGTVAVAPGVRLHVIDSGPATGRPPIVFIPGWSTAGEIWRGQMKRFDDKTRVISFDPRSQGQSTTTAFGNTPEQRAADLHSLLIKKRIRRPVLVGWSQAAQDVAAYVLQYGTADLSGIVLVDAAISDGAIGIAERPQETASQFRLFGIYLRTQGPYLRGMFGAIVSKPQRQGVIDQAVATAMKTPPSIGIAMLVSDLFTVDRTPALARMDCPVLIIAAAASPELERQKAEVKAIKNARFVQIDDAAHAVFLDQPDRFAAALDRFVEQIEHQ